MDNFYLILVVVLFALAISDLIVGVSNDAVNFLNSAFGSKAAPRWAILIIASLGILVGATFSSGMMEVARKGIFHPDQFYFAEIMIIFVAVMLTDIILLDFYNTIGLPTSTTVSIVFELLGAAVAVALVKIMNSDQTLADLGSYINSAKALAIITGILLSVVIAFSAGALVQYITRIIFTYKYDKRFKYFGAIFGGFAITAITYFILIKGAKGSSFISKDALVWIKSNTFTILAFCFVGWSVILQLLVWLVRLDILKVIVLVGTFALAMAFAGNDLVNFIGVPLAGFKSFQAFVASGSGDPYSFTMEMLTGKVQTETYLLLIAGLVMTVTLWFSKKARTVTETELSLSNQNEGDERFGSSYFGRLIVRRSLSANSHLRGILPERIQRSINKSFVQPAAAANIDKKDIPAFDMIRASVNLTVASILIAIGTSLKLPLSTTYVTFMVAMGTSLADRAWGRDSAVYRITGVITVIGGWFFTAFSAFTAAFIFANLINWFGAYAIFGLLVLAIFFVIRSHRAHKLKNETNDSVDNDSLIIKGDAAEQCTYAVSSLTAKIPAIFGKMITGLAYEDRANLKACSKKVNKLNSEVKKIKNQVPSMVKILRADSVYSGAFYVQLIDYLREMAHAISFIVEPVYEYIDNNHKALEAEQIEELNVIQAKLSQFFTHINAIINDRDYGLVNIDSVLEEQEGLLKSIKRFRKEQIKRIKAEKVGTRNSVLFLGVLSETKNLVLYAGNLLKSARDFATSNKDEYQD
ncbi:phosphate permease [Ancylomarina euxinus]|uniref:Phosphate transporter n=1 Tax=Ancylomarina euxinus TaxID=2283627 RepID=A0A425Y7N3_9BACT|nr:inorganic phosphate transporter [Ancylomarina euxinus]MCZ4693677.1 inorganic phosphate transporter [Ancylomarina euxinus]MUP13904.1 phosphate permease [Ancylomarina euxinus]RRG24468.1 phosphate permease [Ancylomarina euxinus]